MLLVLISVTTDHFWAREKPLGKDLYLQCSPEICSNSPASPALPNTFQKEQHQTLLALLLQSPEIGDSLLQCLNPAWSPFAWTAEGWKCVSEAEARWVWVTRERGGKGRRKEGRHKEEREGGKRWTRRRYTAIFNLCCCQRSSGSVQKTWCPQWALRSCSTNPLLSPEQLHLQKQLCFPWTSLAGANEPKTTEDSYRRSAAFVAAQGRAGLGKEAACTGREHEVCTVPITLPNHKKRPYLIAFMWRKEDVILLSCTRLSYPECKLLRCPWESSVPVKIYKQAIKDVGGCCLALMLSGKGFMSLNAH